MWQKQEKKKFSETQSEEFDPKIIHVKLALVVTNASETTKTSHLKKSLTLSLKGI